MAGFFYVAGYLIDERRRWPVITASPRLYFQRFRRHLTFLIWIILRSATVKMSLILHNAIVLIHHKAGRVFEDVDAIEVHCIVLYRYKTPIYLTRHQYTMLLIDIERKQVFIGKIIITHVVAKSVLLLNDVRVMFADIHGFNNVFKASIFRA